MLSKQQQLNLPTRDCKASSSLLLLLLNNNSYGCFYLELSQPYSLKRGLPLSFPDPLAASNRMIFGSAASDIIFLGYPVLSVAWLNWCSHL
ncbi:hypothetical protein J3E68DRAFT_411884 [Trichoderma sp. SZMC 28012]